MGAIGYRKRTSFLAGLTVAQISEFSLIFAGLGLAVGHINEDIVGLITLVGLITIGLSTYLILYSHNIYKYLAPALNIFQRKNKVIEDRGNYSKWKDYDIIIVGMGRFGGRLADMLDERREVRYLAVDFDPAVVKSGLEKGRDIIYGDVGDHELLEYLPYNNSKIIISTVQDYTLSSQLVKMLKRGEYKGKIFLTALNTGEYEILSGCGAEAVLVPQQMAALSFYQSHIEGLKWKS